MLFRWLTLAWSVAAVALFIVIGDDSAMGRAATACFGFIVGIDFVRLIHAQQERRHG